MSLSRIPLQQVFRTRTASLSISSTDSADGPSTNPSSVSSSTQPPSRQPGPFTFSSFSTMAATVGRGTRTPQMLEYERQAEERAREAEAMAEERSLMLETESKIQAEQTRIAQEEYEMRQYYEAEALKHAEEMRLHAEEVRRHQDRVREHERRVLDHEASSEAFAKVIAMPVKEVGRRQISFLAGVGGKANNGAGNGNGILTANGNGNRNGPPNSFPNGV